MKMKVHSFRIQKKMLRKVIEFVWRPEFRWFRPIVEGISNSTESCIESGLQIRSWLGTATIRAYYDYLGKLIRNKNRKVLTSHNFWNQCGAFPMKI
jgi:hypothetical protein